MLKQKNKKFTNERACDSGGRYPDFFMVGAPKAGTTSIYNYLGQHPDIYIPPIKEPHFFSYPEVKDTYYNVSFVDSVGDYKQLYAQATEKQKAGDFSPSYLFREKAALRIRQNCPDANIIMLLRNPVDRAISHYLMDVRDGYQKQPLISCLQKRDWNKKFYREYVEVGFYSNQVRRYYEMFDPDRILILWFENLVDNPLNSIKSILSFLEVKTKTDIRMNRSYNKFQMYKSDIFRIIGNSSLGVNIIKNLPKPIKQFIKPIFINEKKPAFHDERILLKQIFQNDILSLQKMTGRNLEHWL